MSKPDLFNNPMVEAAMKALTPEQKEEYKKVGEYMYSTTNFTESDPQPKSVEEDMVSGLFYVRESLKAGLHPRDMEERELRLMYEVYGSNWYAEYGYNSDDIPAAGKADEDNKKKLHSLADLTKKQLRNLEKKLKKKEWKKKHPGKRYKK